MDPPVLSLTSTAGFPHGQAIKVSYLEALSPSIDLERALINLRKCVPLACRFSDHSQPVCQSVYLSSYGIIVISSHTLSVALPSINRISNYMQLLLPRAAINGDFSSNSGLYRLKLLPNFGLSDKTRNPAFQRQSKTLTREFTW